MNCEDSRCGDRWTYQLILKMLQSHCSVEKDNIYNSKVCLNSLSILILFSQNWDDRKWSKQLNKWRGFNYEASPCTLNMKQCRKSWIRFKTFKFHSFTVQFIKLIVHSICLLLFLTDINLSTIGRLFSTMIQRASRPIVRVRTRI